MRKGQRKGNKYVTEGAVTKVYFNTSGEYFLCDTEDIEKLKAYTWFDDKDGYARTTIRNKTLFAHVLLLGRVEGMEIDHINRNKRDNRKENLRFVSHTVNMRNTVFTKKETAGVWFRKGRYVAGIHVNNKTINLGSFGTVDEARKARKEAELFYWGEQANEA